MAHDRKDEVRKREAEARNQKDEKGRLIPSLLYLSIPHYYENITDSTCYHVDNHRGIRGKISFHKEG